MKNKVFFLLGISFLLAGCGASTTKLSTGGNIKIKKDNISCQTFRENEYWRSTECTAGGVWTNTVGQRRAFKDTKICFSVPNKPGASNRPWGMAIWGPWPKNVNNPVCNAARKFNLIPKQTEELDEYNYEDQAVKEALQGPRRY